MQEITLGVDNLKLKFKIYDPTGKLEEGIRIDVDRDAYSSVWLELMDSIFVGSNERVIYVRHELYFEGWDALEIYFFMVLRRVFISRYNYQELLRCSAYLTMHPMTVWCNRFYSIYRELKRKLLKLLCLAKSCFIYLFIYLFINFIYLFF